MHVDWFQTGGSQSKMDLDLHSIRLISARLDQYTEHQCQIQSQIKVGHSLLVSQLHVWPLQVPLTESHGLVAPAQCLASRATKINTCQASRTEVVWRESRAHKLVQGDGAIRAPCIPGQVRRAQGVPSPSWAPGPCTAVAPGRAHMIPLLNQYCFPCSCRALVHGEGGSHIFVAAPLSKGQF